jgi:protein SCO1/2
MFGLFGVSLLAGAGLLLFGNNAQQHVFEIGGPFKLLDGAGRQVTEADLRGRYALIYFGYTDCPDICPTTLGQIVDALSRLKGAESRIRPVFITVDPAHDTPAIMAQYTASLSPRLLGLTGTSASIEAVEREFHVTAKPAEGGMLDHSAVIYLMAPDFSLLAPIRADMPGPAMAAEIARHLS